MHGWLLSFQCQVWQGLLKNEVIMKIILITGSTGFLGGAVVANLLKTTGQNRLLLLVRAESREDGVLRVRDNLKNFGLNESQLNSITAEQIITGDLACPQAFFEDARLENVTHVINCAAVASFGNNPSIWKVNVDGTYLFAERMSRVKSLERFIHVGTAMSCAPEPNSLVTESRLNSTREQHIVEYTWSKAAIEKKITDSLDNFPLVIARPSIVVGHSDHGCLPSASIFWVFRMVLLLGKFTCGLEDRIDIIPVDYCADALIMLLTAPGVLNEVIHISAGNHSSVTFAEIDEAMAKASGKKALGMEYQRVSYHQLTASRKSFRSVLGPCNERIVLRAMRLYGHFSELNVVFDNTKLLNLGMHKPSKFTDYLERCVVSTQGATIEDLMQVDFK